MANDVFGIVGTTLAAAFHVEAVVAEGGFAVVYRAYHAGFRAPVALKCLKIPQHLGPAEQARFEEQFQAEAELLFKLSASIPTVVRPLHVEAIIAPDGSFMPFLALEWLEGETLDAVSQRRKRSGKAPFSLEELIGVLTPVARALERAHRFIGPEGPISIVHRDMKPENIFVANIGGESVVKILDFGIGKAKSVASQVAGRASQNDAGIGSFTPAYGAPEQWAPRRYGQSGPWTDVWGLALSMVELMAGRPIIDGDQAAMMGTALDPERRPTPRTEGLTISEGLETVFLQALAVDPRNRYATAGEFWDALLAAQEAEKNRPPRLSPVMARRPTGQSGAYSFRASPSPGSELGRHNLIPDLDVPLGTSAALELELPAKPAPSRSGQYRAPVIETVDEPPPAKPSQSGQWQAAQRPEGRGSIPPTSSGRAASPVPPAQPARPSIRPPVVVAVTAPVVTSQRPPPTSVKPLTPRPQPPANTSDEMVRRFRTPALMVVVGILTTLADGAYASANGQVFTLGPLRLAWLAAALVICGIGLAAYRLLEGGD
jgi:serine/threonine-protein kinase